MPYRNAPPPSVEPDPPADALFCERCQIPVFRTEDARCPQCLRRTSVVDPKAPLARSNKLSDLPSGRETPTVWPYTDTCPLCAARPVDDATVLLRVAKVASGFGSLTARILARVRTCASCRGRVVRLERLRYGAVAALLLGMPLLFGFFAADAPGVLAGLLGSLLVVGSITVVVRQNRALRAVLDGSGLTSALARLVPSPSGLFEHEHWALHAEAPKGAKVIDLEEALQAGHADG